MSVVDLWKVKNLNFGRNLPKNENKLLKRENKMNEYEKINYIELPAKDLQATKAFFY